MTKKTLKLYVWEDVLCDYTPGIIVVMAESVDAARRAMARKHGKHSLVVEEMRATPQVFRRPGVGFAVWGGG